MESRTVAPRVVVVGTVTPSRVSVVASAATGIVDDFRVEEGDFVEKGAVLSALRMLTTDLEIAENKALLAEREAAWKEVEAGYRQEEILEAKARMQAESAVRDSTRNRLERTKSLFTQKAASQDDLDDALQKAEAAEQMYLASRARYDMLKSGHRPETKEQARARFEAQREHVAFLIEEREKRITRAPFNGFVVAEQTHEGQYLALGAPIVTLADLDEVDVVANVDEKDIHHVQLGAEVDVRFETQGSERWTGRIVAIVPKSAWQAGSRGFPVKVRLANRMVEASPGVRLPVLKEGLTAHVTFRGQPHETTVVHKDTLVRASGKAIVYVFVPDAITPAAVRRAVPAGTPLPAELEKLLGNAPEDAPLDIAALQALTQAHPQWLRLLTSGQVQPLPVEEGLDDGSDVEIRGPGLAAGTWVVSEGAERLIPFQKVSVPTGTDAPAAPGQPAAQGPPAGEGQPAAPTQAPPNPAPAKKS